MRKQSYLSTVINNKAKFSKQQVVMDDEARDLYVKLEMRGCDHFIKALTNNDIRNSKVTVYDAKRAVFRYGREVSSLKGKNTRRKLVSINNIPKIELPKSIIDFHFTVFLVVDYMIIQGIPFMYN